MYIAVHSLMALSIWAFERILLFWSKQSWASFFVHDWEGLDFKMPL